MVLFNNQLTSYVSYSILLSTIWLLHTCP